MGAVRATVVGGIGALMVTGLWTILFPQLRDADELTAAQLRSDLHSSPKDNLQPAARE
jgi:hypothetical protein